VSDNEAREATSQKSVAEAVLDGRYVLRRLRSSGGGADVHVAVHRYTSRQVAVKIPHPENPKGATRLAREIAALALVRGTPGVIEMLDAGESEQGPYLVLELLEGRTLAGLLLARGKLSVDEVVKIGTSVADALHACHERGVVHRDVKPMSLFVSRQPGKELALCDFGVAKIAGVADDVASLSPIGSDDYAAPELLADPATADARADVFALGATLYECLTGAVPYEPGRDAVPGALSEARPDVPAALREVLEHATSHDAALRFATARELSEALRACATAPMDSVRVLGQPRPRPESVPVSATAPSLAEPAPAPATPATRRKHARAPYSTLARLSRSGGERVDGRLEELSEGGVQFVSDRAIAVGDVVKIRFALPASGRIAEVWCVSRWTRAGRGGHATGFEMTDPPEDIRAEIRQYVRIMSGE
jgi:serine/threonine-protein kinase